jgi:hypothetical protein
MSKKTEGKLDKDIQEYFDKLTTKNIAFVLGKVIGYILLICLIFLFGFLVGWLL